MFIVDRKVLSVGSGYRHHEHLFLSVCEQQFHAVFKKDITCSEMLRNVSVIAKCSCKQDLHILEALFIKELNPIINKVQWDF